MAQDSDVVSTRRSLRLNPFAIVAALLGAAAFAAALALKSVQVGRAPADYYGVLRWLAPEIGLAPLTVLLGIVAMILARAARDVRSLAVGLLGSGLGAAGLVIALTYAPPNAEDLRSRSVANVAAILKGLIEYQTDHGALPPAAHWTQALGSYVHDPAVWKDPFTGKPGYALNAAIAGRRPASFAAEPGSVVAVFESDRGANAAGGPELLPRKLRPYGRHIAGFLDGHISTVEDPRYGKTRELWMVWNPDAPPARPGADDNAGRR
jgi:hypothetical protein